MRSWSDFHSARRTGRGSSITEADVSRAVSAFVDSGGVVRRLPDEREPPRSLLDGAVGAHSGFEEMRSRSPIQTPERLW